MRKSILTAIDGSAGSVEVLDAVEDFARLTEGNVHVVHVGLPSVADGDAGRLILQDAVSRLRCVGVAAGGEVSDNPDVCGFLSDRARELGSTLIIVSPKHYGGRS